MPHEFVYHKNMAQERTKFWHINDVELLHAYYITHSFDRHIHEGYAIGVIEQGAEKFYYRGGNHVAPAGSVVVINPGEIHTGQAITQEDGWKYRMMYPSIATMQQFNGTIPYFGDPVIHDKTLAAMMHRAHTILETSDSNLERDSYLHLVFETMVNQYAVNRTIQRRISNEPSIVQKIRTYIENNYAENITLDELTSLAGLTPYHLVRVFHQQVGLPPHKYLIHVRIERAKALLKMGETLAQVAFMTGFTDQSHFTRRFKRVVGVTPGQYR